MPSYMHTLLHPYTHTFIHPYTHTPIHSYIHTPIHPYTHTLIHSYTLTHTHTHTYTQTHNFACTHISTRPHSLQTHTRTHKHTHTIRSTRPGLGWHISGERAIWNLGEFWRTVYNFEYVHHDNAHRQGTVIPRLQLHTATTHCNNTLQQHTATTHCNNTLQQRCITWFPILTYTRLQLASNIHTHTLKHTHTHTHTNTSAKRFSNLDFRYVSRERARTIEIWTPRCNNTLRHTATNVRISWSTGVHIQMDWRQRLIIWDRYRWNMLQCCQCAVAVCCSVML